LRSFSFYFHKSFGYHFIPFSLVTEGSRLIMYVFTVSISTSGSWLVSNPNKLLALLGFLVSGLLEYFDDTVDSFGKLLDIL